jgi:hypothetical protein
MTDQSIYLVREKQPSTTTADTSPRLSSCAAAFSGLTELT